MKAIATICLLLASPGAIHFALGASGRDRPSRIAIKDSPKGPGSSG